MISYCYIIKFSELVNKKLIAINFFDISEMNYCCKLSVSSSMLIAHLTHDHHSELACYQSIGVNACSVLFTENLNIIN